MGWAAKRTRGGVLVIHENRGLNDSIRAMGALAASGYSALAIDLLSEEGGTGSLPTSSRRWRRWERYLRRVSCRHESGVTEIRRRLPKKKVQPPASASEAV